MPKDDIGPSSRANPLLSSIGRSAEYAVSIALVGVCLIVGAAIWLLRPSDDAQSSGTADVSTNSTSAGDLQTAEQAALENWQKKLGGEFSQMEQQRQLNQQKAELDQHSEAARQAELELRKQAAAAAAAASRASPATTSAPAPKPAPPPTTVATVAPPAAAPRAAPVLTEAKVDWSGCRRPEYPARSVESREEGTVVMNFDIDASGNISTSRIAQSSGFDRLDQAALRALNKCQFKPATSNGIPIAASTQVRFGWKLN